VVEDHLKSIVPPNIVDNPQNPILTHHVLSEGNMGKITKTYPIDILVKPGIIEHLHIGMNCTPKEVIAFTALFKEFHDVFSWSYEEILRIDPSIVVHEIKIYPDAKPVCKKLRPVHLRKTVVIKAEVEKLLKVGFIYLVPLTKWVSNIVSVRKKQGTIMVCVDYRDLNLACRKDNTLPHLSTKSSITMPEALSADLWMAFPAIIRLRYSHSISIKLLLFVLGALSHIKSCHLVFKMLGLHSSGPCPMAFTISYILLIPIFMTYPHIQIIRKII